MTKALQSRCGQIVIPAVFVIPSLILFLFLLFEIAKLSREKIRHQFAIDSAAFIEMTNYSDFLNRTAYVNGPFPDRIFKEAYLNDKKEAANRSGRTLSVFEALYQSGAFPSYSGDKKLDDEPRWDIKFFDESGRGPGMNKARPEVSKVVLITPKLATDYMIQWGEVANSNEQRSGGIYGFYSTVYTLLGSVEESQKNVFDKLTQNSSFFRKSYSLNTGECSDEADCGKAGVSGFRKLSPELHYSEEIEFSAKVPQPCAAYMPNNEGCYSIGTTSPPMKMRLFQLATVSPDQLRELGAPGEGYHVYQGWKPEKNYSNYFNVDLSGFSCKESGIGSDEFCVHAMIASQCPDETGGNNCVWPNPTPKYQTRLYP